jgi:aspartate/methionine/tyrosine aminotransferase
VSAENVVVFAGAQSALFSCVLCIADPGDEIAVFEPRYVTYDGVIDTPGAVRIDVPLAAPQGFRFDPDALARAVTPRTRAVLLNTPHNPTGVVAAREELEAIAAIAKRHDLWVLSDEVYASLTYDAEHVAIASLPGMAERTVTLDAFSKTYAMTGWRCGYVAAPANVIDAMARIKAVTTGPVATVSQWAGLAAMTGPQDCVSQYKEIYTERRAVLLEGLDRVGFAYGEPRGGLFVWADSSSTGIHAAELSLLLLQEGRVLVFPGTAFGEKWREYVRITMLEPIDVLREAVERMLPVIERYRL